MVGSRACSAITKTGETCGATPLHDADVCFWHDPENAAEAAEARRLGGLRRRREKTLSGAYEIESVDSVTEIRRVIEVVIFDALGMENSVARGRLLIAAAQAATKLLEVGELEERLARIEATLRPRVLRERQRR
jgi:hypothetical protein